MTLRSRLAALAAVVVALCSMVLVLLDQRPAQAHGAMMQPGSRTFFCWKDGLSSTGEIKPKNPACAAAVAQSGTNPLYNWFSVLRSDGEGRTRGFVPDGQLCSGGNSTFSGWNQARNDWPLTHLTAGANMRWSYNAWAAHPGWFYLYVTKDSWSPTRPLTWNDIEEQPFLTVDHPPLTGSVGTVEGHYGWHGRLPQGKSGKHIIYSVWKRSDSKETFYGCSDVVFDGGNGEVTGIGGEPGPGPTGTTSPTSTTAGPPGACTAEYAVTNSWAGGAQVTVTVRNPGSTPVRGWTVRWTAQAGQRISSLWDATHSVTDSAVTVKNASWNASVPAGGQAAFSFNVESTGDHKPASPLTCASP
ncbi:lytic polysaccharide monooxygenase [Crossiella sp. CA-258035]|uniref:lytic polysaccharide monooxygenase auxiliary activity family 9 protein n=1 Tax=Crossiella sp. CA-258035 TaxID=2981138 RepID=UPI0024BCAB8F|nr:lytic polysaccharide monooxygenase [Crossiella sp. CA-258035]WHT22702.1 lytic polysaccharide monooxygenase [Crossiella sp. CA-258035]